MVLPFDKIVANIITIGKGTASGNDGIINTNSTTSFVRPDNDIVVGENLITDWDLAFHNTQNAIMLNSSKKMQISQTILIFKKMIYEKIYLID